ncbi:ParA family protein [Brochothrix thermosphacta]|uniref:ParA family protein n=1 Tax=Brochothrix thermosphacta TaxID=2756 RepID=UPI00271382F4|nr:ParA family protein [Brochothrix thermosphacta]MDO7864917.1 ParA family protein [Brochothrix thermosphacta]
MAVKLTFNNTKGGVSKTTSIVNLAGALLKTYPNSKILIVDTDGQGNTSTSFNLSKAKYEDTIYDVFIGEKDPEEVIINLYGNIDTIPANADMDFLDFDFMSETREQDIVSIYEFLSKDKDVINLDYKDFRKALGGQLKESRYFNLLKGKFDKLDEIYDFILFDTPPEMKAVTSSVLAISDYVIVPFEPDAYSAEGISRLLRRILTIEKEYNPKLKIAGLLPVKVDKRTKLHNEVMLQVLKFANKNGINHFDTTIPQSVRFASATASGLPATLLNKSTSKFTESYFKLLEEMQDMGIFPKK